MNTSAKKRRIEGFEPCGPIAAIIDNETRGKGHGAKTRMFEQAILLAYGPKYPKLSARYKILREEGAI